MSSFQSGEEITRETILAARVPTLSDEQQFEALTEQCVHEILPDLFLGGTDYTPSKIVMYDGSVKRNEDIEYAAFVSATLWVTEDGYHIPLDKPRFVFPPDLTRLVRPDITLASLQSKGAMSDALSFIHHHRTRSPSSSSDKGEKGESEATAEAEAEAAASSNNRRVLVHCQQGKDRSASVVIAYVMNVFEVTFEQALQFVRSKRFIAEPGDMYMEYLRSIEGHRILSPPAAGEEAREGRGEGDGIEAAAAAAAAI